MLDKYSGMDIPAVRKRLEGILYAEKHLKEKLSIEKQSLLQHPPRTLDEMTQSTAKLQKIGKQVEGLARDIETLEYVFVVFRKLNDRLKRHGNGASVLDRALIINHAVSTIGSYATRLPITHSSISTARIVRRCKSGNRRPL